MNLTGITSREQLYNRLSHISNEKERRETAQKFWDIHKRENPIVTEIKMIDTLPVSDRAKIQAVSDERQGGNGYWMYLDGYTNLEMAEEHGLHIIHETTFAECITQLRAAVLCECQECRPDLVKPVEPKELLPTINKGYVLGYIRGNSTCLNECSMSNGTKFPTQIEFRTVNGHTFVLFLYGSEGCNGFDIFLNADTSNSLLDTLQAFKDLEVK